MVLPLVVPQDLDEGLEPLGLPQPLVLQDLVGPFDGSPFQLEVSLQPRPHLVAFRLVHVLTVDEADGALAQLQVFHRVELHHVQEVPHEEALHRVFRRVEEIDQLRFRGQLLLQQLDHLLLLAILTIKSDIVTHRNVSHEHAVG